MWKQLKQKSAAIFVFFFVFSFCILDGGYPEPAACLLKMNVKLSVDLTIEHSWLQASSLQVCSSVGRLCSRAYPARGSGGFFFLEEGDWLAGWGGGKGDQSLSLAQRLFWWTTEDSLCSLRSLDSASSTQQIQRICRALAQARPRTARERRAPTDSDRFTECQRGAKQTHKIKSNMQKCSWESHVITGIGDFSPSTFFSSFEVKAAAAVTKWNINHFTLFWHDI